MHCVSRSCKYESRLLFFLIFVVLRTCLQPHQQHAARLPGDVYAAAGVQQQGQQLAALQIWLRAFLNPDVGTVTSATLVTLAIAWRPDVHFVLHAAVCACA